MSDPTTAWLRERSTASERLRAQADVEFWQAKTSSPLRDMLFIGLAAGVFAVGFYFTGLKPYLEGKTQ